MQIGKSRTTEELSRLWEDKNAPREFATRHMGLKHMPYSPSISKCGGAIVILFVFQGLARIFNPYPVRNLHYKN